MCEKCMEEAQNIDPRFIKLMEDIMPELQALQDKLEQPTREMLNMVTVSTETGIEIVLGEMPPEDREYMEQVQKRAARSIGLALVTGWYGVLLGVNQEKKQIPDQQQAMQVAHTLMSMVSKAAGEAISYNYFLHNVKKH